MPCLLRAQRRHVVVVVPLILSTFLAAPAVAAEIFKCVAKDGSPLFQNFPCDVDSRGWLPSDPTVAKTPPAPSPAAAVAEKQKAAAAGGAPSAKPAAAAPSDPRVGMTSEEVKALMGEPEEMIEDEPASGRVSIWKYADGRSVQFDHKHRVLGVQR